MTDEDRTDEGPEHIGLDGSALDKALDGGFAAARDEATGPGESVLERPGESVLERIGEIAGSKPKVFLRDETAGDTPMLKPLAPEERLSAGKYVVQGELGRGGVGAVHKGHDQDLGRDVAMKFLHERYREDGAILHRFVEEAQIGGQLQHPGIVPGLRPRHAGRASRSSAMKLVKGRRSRRSCCRGARPSPARPTTARPSWRSSSSVPDAWRTPTRAASCTAT